MRGPDRLVGGLCPSPPLKSKGDASTEGWTPRDGRGVSLCDRAKPQVLPRLRDQARGKVGSSSWMAPLLSRPTGHRHFSEIDPVADDDAAFVRNEQPPDAGLDQ